MATFDVEPLTMRVLDITHTVLFSQSCINFDNRMRGNCWDLAMLRACYKKAYKTAAAARLARDNCGERTAYERMVLYGRGIDARKKYKGVTVDLL